MPKMHFTDTNLTAIPTARRRGTPTIRTPKRPRQHRVGKDQRSCFGARGVRQYGLQHRHSAVNRNISVAHPLPALQMTAIWSSVGPDVT